MLWPVYWGDKTISQQMSGPTWEGRFYRSRLSSLLTFYGKGAFFRGQWGTQFGQRGQLVYNKHKEGHLSQTGTTIPEQRWGTSTQSVYHTLFNATLMSLTHDLTTIYTFRHVNWRIENSLSWNHHLHIPWWLVYDVCATCVEINASWHSLEQKKWHWEAMKCLQQNKNKLNVTNYY